jgi:hypothetical protein
VGRVRDGVNAKNCCTRYPWVQSLTLVNSPATSPLPPPDRGFCRALDGRVRRRCA